MQFLGSVVVVVLSICRHFAIFVSIDGRAKLPTVKFQQIFWFPVMPLGLRFLGL